MARDKAKHAAYMREYRRRRYRDDPAFRAGILRSNKAQREKIKRETLDAYGGAVCACCGEDSIEFLAVDHINGGGTAERKLSGYRGGWQFYSWLKRNGYPEGYQVLCHNCNFAKSAYGSCPVHDGSRERSTEWQSS